RMLGIGAIEARHGDPAWRVNDLFADEPEILAIDAADMGDALAPFRSEARGPDVRRLGDVGVGVDGLEGVEHFRPSFFSICNGCYGVAASSWPLPAILACRDSQRGGRDGTTRRRR